MYKTTDVNKVSIIVNSRGYFCLGWESDTSLATQNKNRSTINNNVNNDVQQ